MGFTTVPLEQFFTFLLVFWDLSYGAIWSKLSGRILVRLGSWERSGDLFFCERGLRAPRAARAGLVRRVPASRGKSATVWVEIQSGILKP